MTSQNRVGKNDSQGRFMQRSNNASPDIVLMQIAYTDTMGDRKIIEKQVKVGFQNIASMDGQTAIGRRGTVQQASVFPDYAYYFIGIAVLAGIVLGNRKYRSRKLK